MKTSGVLSVALACAVLGACAPKPAVVTAAPAPAIEQLATTKQVMLGLTIPASDILFQLGDHAPTDDAGWARIEATAAMLGESGNLLLAGPRLVDQPEWQQFARELVARSKDAMAAAQKKDIEAVLEAGNGLYEVCESCHNKYMPAKVAEQD
jgi:hypothetical protein